MDGSLRIGRLFDIPILLHYTFILVIPLFAFIIGSEIGPTTDMLKEIFNVPIDTSLITTGWMPWILGTVVALGLFWECFVHELAHSLVARAKGLRCRASRFNVRRDRPDGGRDTGAKNRTSDGPCRPS